MRRAQDRFVRVAALLPDQLVAPARAETVLREEPLTPQSVVFFDGPHHVATGNVCAQLGECTRHPSGIVEQRWNCEEPSSSDSSMSRVEAQSAGYALQLDGSDPGERHRRSTGRIHDL